MTATTTVVNLRHESYDVYIGRGSIWGNPYVISHVPSAWARYRVATRAEAIEAYERWIQTQPVLLGHLHTLRGKRLGCYCKPLPCHGDILARLADSPSR